MKIGDLIKLTNIGSSAIGIVLRAIEPDDPTWAGYGEWLIFFPTLRYHHPCYAHEIEVVSESR